MTVQYGRLRAASIGTLMVAAMVAAPQAARAAQTLDQQQTVNDGAFPIGDFGNPPTLHPLEAQTFTAGQSGPLSKVELKVVRAAVTPATNPATGPLTIEIRALDSGDGPSEIPVASTVLAAASIPDGPPVSAAFVPFSFSSPAQVVAGGKYAIVASTTDGTGGYEIAGSGSNDYAGGSVWTADSPSDPFAETTGFDLAFKTYVGLPVTAPAFDPACDADGVKAGYHVIKGTDGPDKLNGTSGADLIYGFGGNDVIKGRGGADLICAGSGDDIVIAGNGRDRVFAGSGNDRVNGGAGNDRVRGGDGNDLLIGRDGRDALNGENGNDRLRGNKGADHLNGNAGNDVIRGGDGDDDINGGPGTNDIKQ